MHLYPRWPQYTRDCMPCSCTALPGVAHGDLAPDGCSWLRANPAWHAADMQAARRLQRRTCASSISASPAARCLSRTGRAPCVLKLLQLTYAVCKRCCARCARARCPSSRSMATRPSTASRAASSRRPTTPMRTCWCARPQVHLGGGGAGARGVSLEGRPARWGQSASASLGRSPKNMIVSCITAPPAFAFLWLGGAG